MATGAKIQPLAPDDLVPELWRDIHVASLTDPIGDPHHRHTPPTGKYELIALDQISVELSGNRLTRLGGLGDLLFDPGELRFGLSPLLAACPVQLLEFRLLRLERGRASLQLFEDMNHRF